MSEAREPSRVERALAPFFRDMGLWPVTLVVVAHGILAVAVLLLAVVRGPGGFAIAGFTVLVLASLAALGHDLARRRLGALGATVLLCWIAGALAAWGADRTGLY